MRAEIWKLKSKLADNEMCAKNMEEVAVNTVKEKYDLLEELNDSKIKVMQLKGRLSHERLVNKEKSSCYTYILLKNQ